MGNILEKLANYINFYHELLDKMVEFVLNATKDH